MRHYFDVVLHPSTGAALQDVQVRLFDRATDALIPIYADENGTPIITVSGIADTAVTDGDGRFSLYVEPGIYTIRMYMGEALQLVTRNVWITEGVTPEDLSGSDGATKVGYGNETVDAALGERPTNTALAQPTSAATIGTTDGNVQSDLDGIKTDIGGVQTEIVEQVGGFDIAPSGKVSPLGGVVRQPSAGAGWDFIIDSGHEPLNMSGTLVVNASGNLEVPYATTYGKVGVVPVSLDETFAGLGIFAGGSVGNNKLTISAYKTLDASVNLQTANVVPSTYFTGRVSAADNGDGTITITHPSVGTSTLVPQITSLSGPYNHKVISYTATTIVIGTFTRLRFRVWYNGTAWQVATPAKVKPTVTSFGAGGLVIAYNQTIPTAYTLPLIGCAKDGNTIAKVGIGSSATTQVVLGFRDFSGAAVTTPSTEMDITIELPIEVLAETPLGAASISRQNCKLNLGDVYSPDGNFWIGPGLNVR